MRSKEKCRKTKKKDYWWYNIGRKKWIERLKIRQPERSSTVSCYRKSARVSATYRFSLLLTSRALLGLFRRRFHATHIDNLSGLSAWSRRRRLPSGVGGSVGRDDSRYLPRWRRRGRSRHPPLRHRRWGRRSDRSRPLFRFRRRSGMVFFGPGPLDGSRSDR